MYTGAKDIEQLGIVDKWNGLYYSPFYNDTCALINGTSGELWPPVAKRDTIDLFLSDLCSSITLSYVKSSSEIYGLKGKKFVGKEINFDNGSVYPEQKCFNDDRVFPSGIRSISKCRYVIRAISCLLTLIFKCGLRLRGICLRNLARVLFKAVIFLCCYFTTPRKSFFVPLQIRSTRFRFLSAFLPRGSDL